MIGRAVKAVIDWEFTPLFLPSLKLSRSFWLASAMGAVIHIVGRGSNRVPPLYVPYGFYSSLGGGQSLNVDPQEFSPVRSSVCYKGLLRRESEVKRLQEFSRYTLLKFLASSLVPQTPIIQSSAYLT